jgi:hypothetical protein
MVADVVGLVGFVPIVSRINDFHHFLHDVDNDFLIRLIEEIFHFVDASLFPVVD